MNPEDKICSLRELQIRIQGLPRPLIMTNGVFDLLHRGHASYLHQAASHGATLVVAVNSDMSVRMLNKGSDRPYTSGDDRAYMLACLSSVDLLILFDEHSPLDLIKKIRPDIYVKGGDYNMEILEESNAVRQWGGKAMAIPFLSGFSTTSLVEKIRQN
jgi:rfaE bifunctional protein nucleotidyltransferase chain/domain